MKKSILSLENGLDTCLFNGLNEVKNKLGGSTSKLRFRGVRGALFAVFLLFASLAMADTAHADYYSQGTILSNNMLSGATGVSAIASVTVTATLPTNTTAKIKYSQDNLHFYNAAGTEEGWDTISAGTNTIDISARGWSDSIFYYKIELATTDSAATPVISDVQVNYTGSATPAVSGTHYQMQGTLLSTNVLSGASNVTAIGSVTVTATLPGGSTAKIKYSQDNANFYNAAGTQEGWDTVAAGTNAIDISALGWTGGIFYYKLEWSVIDDAQTPVISDVTVDYTGDVALPPNCSGHCETSGAFVSTDLMIGVATAMRGTEYFAYSIPNLPGGASVTAQFSQDGANWYSSDGTPWGADTLSSGVHMKESTALSLATLNWADGTSFYYKLNLTTVDDTQVPVVTYAGLLFAQMTTISAQLDGPAKSSLVGWWTFDGNDMTSTLAYDKSGQGNTGTLTNSPTKTIGYLGQGLSFDGVNDYVQASNASSLQFANATPITLSAWVKPSQVAAYASFLVKGRDTTDSEANYAFRQSSTGKLEFYYNESGNTNWHVWTTSSSAFPTANQWYHVAVTYTFGTGSSIKAYINGENYTGSWTSGTGNVAPDISTQKLMIGQITTGERFSGLIDDVRIYNTALTASQVSDLYNTGKVVLNSTKKIYITTPGAGTFTAPADWPGTADRVEVIGGGAAGGYASNLSLAGAGGGGGAYAKKSNVSISNGASLQVGSGGVSSAGAGGDTWVVSTGTIKAAGAPAHTYNVAGIGGAAGSSVGDIVYSGGNGGSILAQVSMGGGGGGGAAGPGGVGKNGGNSGNGTCCEISGGGGGGGAAGGSSTAGNNSGTGDGAGASGGKAQDNTAGGTANNNGSHGSGGGGGGANFNGGQGGAGVEWDSTHGAGGGGGGGGGGGSSSNGGAGGAGGSYGGGGGGGGQDGLFTPQYNDGGAGGQGIIVITYTPL